MEVQVEKEQEMRHRFCQIGGREYSIDGNGHALRPLMPGEDPPQGVQVTVPHPDAGLRAMGWRLAIIFLPLVGIALVVVGLLVAGY